ncbi:hypothetical protein HanOQP8_Chr15g0571301 [Helianthus annuus]|nr:hypothetical protein HanIR_Chr15g0751251 [Helianthus annuus]KAJ0652361.1 hypothetical protein HanOQP8_Chr15g0571301 [Helianthus annuus]
MDVLARRSIYCISDLCAFSGEVEESCEHTFVSCPFIQSLWQVIGQWCKVQAIYAFSFRDLLGLHDSINGSKKKRKAFHSIILTTIWCVWRTRNDVVFNRALVSLAKAIEETKAMSMLWVKRRAKE